MYKRNMGLKIQNHRKSHTEATTEKPKPQMVKLLFALGHSNALQDDGFLLWRMEMGFLLAGMLLGEGLSLLDLTAAPGWPGHLA